MVNRVKKWWDGFGGPGTQRQRLALIILGLLTVLGLSVAWMTVRGLAAQHHLQAAQASLVEVKGALGTRDVATARRALGNAGEETRKARALTSDPVWGTASAVPWFGRTPRAIVTIVTVTDETVRTTLPPLIAVAADLDPAKLRQSGTRLNLRPWERATPSLVLGHRRIARASSTVARLDGPLPGPVFRRVQQIHIELRSLSHALDAASKLARLLPSMLGANGERRYLIAVQNPAEARGTGGLLAAYGVVVIKSGRLRLARLGPNTDLRGAPKLPVDLGEEFSALYGNDPALWVNSNMSPHFPYAARIWLALYERQFDVSLDGVFLVDPVMFGHLLTATGPIVLRDGTRMDGPNAPRFIMSTIYERYPSLEDDRVRDAFLVDLGRSVIEQVLSESTAPRRLLDALLKSAQEDRLRIFSAHSEEQRLLNGTRVGGILYAGQRPYASAVIVNGGNNKLDYYLDRTVRYTLGPCADGRRMSQLTIKVNNRAPISGLPEYVKGNTLAPEGGTAPEPGTNRLLIYVFATRGAELQGAELDARPISAMHFGVQRRHPVFAFTVDLEPGQTRHAVLQYSEPARLGTPILAEQPLVRPQRSVVSATSCDE